MLPVSKLISYNHTRNAVNFATSTERHFKLEFLIYDNDELINNFQMKFKTLDNGEL